jgi:hypothetical protein
MYQKDFKNILKVTQWSKGIRGTCDSSNNMVGPMHSLEDQYTPSRMISKIVIRKSLCNHKNINMYFTSKSQEISQSSLFWI